MDISSAPGTLGIDPGKPRRIQAKYRILFGLTVATVALDRLTKSMILSRFSLGQSLSLVDGIFDLTYVRNTGAAFGMLARTDPAFRVPFFVIVPLAALFAIGYAFRKIPERDLTLATALSLVVGGALGNLIDRVWLGYVVDFLDFHWQYRYHFPAFNVADSAICVGVGLLMLDLCFKEKKESKLDASATH